MPQYPYNTPVGVNYKNITAAGTVPVKTSGGLLNSIVINAPGTAASTFVLNDGTVATIGTLDVATTAIPTTINYGVNFTQGLTIVATGTALANVTVTYR
jgi:hypothetical protein